MKCLVKYPKRAYVKSEKKHPMHKQDFYVCCNVWRLEQENGKLPFLNTETKRVKWLEFNLG